MADVKRNLELKITADSKQAEANVQSFTSSLGKIAIGAGAAVAGVALINKGIDTLGAAISRGQGVNELTGAFKRLQEQAGSTADKGIERLRSATKGLLTDTALMQRSNLASQLGITPELFAEIASGAETLGDALKIDLGESLDALTEGFGRGNDRALKRLGIDVDLIAAQKQFAEANKRTVETLTEEEKKYAARTVALEGFRKAVNAAQADQTSAGDAVTRISVIYENWVDRIASAVEKNESLAGGLEDVATALSEIDPAPLIKGIEAVIGVVGRAISLMGDLVEATDTVFNLSKKEQLREAKVSRASAVGNIRGLQNTANANRNDLLGPLTPEQEADLIEYSKEIAKLDAQIAELEGTSKKATTAVTGTADAASLLGAKPKAGADALKKSLEEAAKKAEEAKEALKELASSNEQNEVGRGLEAAIKNLDQTSFEALKARFRDNVREGLSEGLDLTNPEAKAQVERGVELATSELEDKWSDATKKSVEEQEKKTKEAFQASVDFYADILTPMFEDAAFNMEDIFKDAFKRVAIGFGSQLLATISQSMGFDVGSMGGAQGLGQALAQKIFGGGVSAATTAAGAPATPVIMNGTPAAGGGALSGASLSASLASFGMSAGIAAGLYLTQRGLFDAAEGKKTKTATDYASRTQAAISSFGFSEVYRAFGFGPSQNPDRLARRAVRDQLQETGLGDNLTFRTTRGVGDIKSADFNTDPNNRIVQGLIPFANPLAQIVTGGDDKLSKDFAGIFANAAGDAGSLNEALINMKSLMEGLNITAEDAKDQLKELFLDGKVELDEFKSGVADLNVLAQDNLIGTGSVADGLAIVGEEATSNRAKLTALGLTFKEFGEIGINSTAGIVQYLTDRFGPDAGEVFNRLAAIGIDSFEDVKNASVDQIAAYFEILQSLPDAFAEASEQAKNKIKQDNEEIGKSYKKLKDQATFENTPTPTTNPGTDGNSKRLQYSKFNNTRAA